MKYKANFAGFSYIEADSEQEAEDVFFEGYEVYSEEEITSVEEVDDFVISFS